MTCHLTAHACTGCLRVWEHIQYAWRRQARTRALTELWICDDCRPALGEEDEEEDDEGLQRQFWCSTFDRKYTPRAERENYGVPEGRKTNQGQPPK